jgi:hypothetical protein
MGLAPKQRAAREGVPKSGKVGKGFNKHSHEAFGELEFSLAAQQKRHSTIGNNRKGSSR